jgi:hypothetical protein
MLSLIRVLKSGRERWHGLGRRRPDLTQDPGGVPADARVGIAKGGDQCRHGRRPDLL